MTKTILRTSLALVAVLAILITIGVHIANAGPRLGQVPQVQHSTHLGLLDRAAQPVSPAVELRLLDSHASNLLTHPLELVLRPLNEKLLVQQHRHSHLNVLDRSLLDR